MSHEDQLARRLSDRGLDAIHESKWERAEQLFLNALKHSPKDDGIRQKYASCLWRRGAKSEAIREINKAIELTAAQDVQLIVQLGDMLFDSGDFTAAMQQAERALSIDPQIGTAWKLKGRIEQKLGKPRVALASYHRAISYLPDDQDLRIASAELYFALDRPQRAISSLERIRDENQEKSLPIRFYHLRGLAFSRMGRYEDAVSELSEANRNSEYPSVDLLTDLATAQFKAGQLSAAMETTSIAMGLATPQQQESLEQLQVEIAVLEPDRTKIR